MFRDFNLRRGATADFATVGLLVLAATATAADRTSSVWAELTARQKLLQTQLAKLPTDYKSDETAAVTGRLLDADRRMLALPAADDVQKKLHEDALQDAVKRLNWLEDRRLSREEWVAAVELKRQMVALLTANRGGSHYITITARSQLAYDERLVALKPQEARALYRAVEDQDQVSMLLSAGNYAAAIPPGERSAATERRLMGGPNYVLCMALERLAQAYEGNGDFVRAEPLFREVAEDRKASLGEDHPAYAASQNNLAHLYENLSRYADAEPLYARAVAIYRKTLGEEHNAYLTALGNLAVLYQAEGKMAQAQPLLEKVREVRKRTVGENDPQYAQSLSNLALFFAAKQNFAGAEPLFVQAAEIYKKANGETHSDYGKALSNLAANYEARGEYPKAQSLYLKALEIQKKALGEDHPDCLATIGNLANLYHDQRDYARAVPYSLRVAEITRKLFGEKSYRYSVAVNNLASLYWSQGDYARAEPLYRLVVEIDKVVLGEKHPGRATALNNLATVCQAKGDAASAEKYFLQSLEIQKNTTGEDNPNYASDLANLAGLYHENGDFAKAAPMFEKAVGILKRTVGENHPDYANALNSLAYSYQSLGDFDRAEAAYLRALEINGKVLGENHPQYAISLHSLASLYKQRGDLDRAEPLARRAVAIQLGQLEAAAAAQSQRQQLAMLDDVRRFLNHYLALAAAKDEFTTNAYRQILAWKGIVFRRQRLARAAEQTPELAALFRQLQLVSGQLVARAWARPDPKQLDQWRAEIAALSEKKERLEADLSARSAAFRRAKKPAELEDIQAALPKDAALVDFLEYEHSSLVAVPQRGGVGVRFDQTPAGSKVSAVPPGGAAAKDGRLKPGDVILAVADGNGKWIITAGKTTDAVRDLMIGDAGTKVALRFQREGEATPRDIELTRAVLPWQQKYENKWETETVAFVVRHEGPVARINLGPARPITAMVEQWRQTCGESATSVAAGKLLRDKVWQPIAAHIGNARIILLSPDGALSKLPFGALPGRQEGKYLIEEYPLAIVPTPQMIPEILATPASQPKSGKLLLVGNIDYDHRPGEAATMGHVPQNPVETASRGFVHFNRLPATEREVASLERLYRQSFGTSGIRTLQNAEAGKAAFLEAARGYRYLHLATHGFFLPQPPPGVAAGGGTAGGGNIVSPGAELHVGLFCGLALAGANRPAVVGDKGGNRDNGILTAEEIGSMNLEGVQLVTLSACETGLGKEAGGEGLLGLQRSFQAAGARAVVASLWKVPDEETKALMGEFYTNLWQRKLSPLEALRQAQLTMLHKYDAQAGHLRAPDFGQTVPLASGGTTEKMTPRWKTLLPEYWAAFVLSGDWR